MVCPALGHSSTLGTNRKLLLALNTDDKCAPFVSVYIILQVSNVDTETILNCNYIHKCLFYTLFGGRRMFYHLV